MGSVDRGPAASEGAARHFLFPRGLFQTALFPKVFVPKAFLVPSPEVLGSAGHGLRERRAYFPNFVGRENLAVNSWDRRWAVAKALIPDWESLGWAFPSDLYPDPL